MYFLYLKAFHIIGAIVWFAGLFYLGRLFVYHKELSIHPKPEREALKIQYSTMERRLYYGITWPGLCITILFGLAMLIEWGTPKWLLVKLCFVIFLVFYHFFCGHLRKKLLYEECKWKAKHLRLFNEIPTFFLVSIVFLAVFKENLVWTVFILIIFFLCLIIVGTIYFFSKRRKI